MKSRTNAIVMLLAACAASMFMHHYVANVALAVVHFQHDASPYTFSQPAYELWRMMRDSLWAEAAEPDPVGGFATAPRASAPSTKPKMAVWKKTGAARLKHNRLWAEAALPDAVSGFTTTPPAAAPTTKPKTAVLKKPGAATDPAAEPKDPDAAPAAESLTPLGQKLLSEAEAQANHFFWAFAAALSIRSSSRSAFK
jgi:hypothetical protein